ncbi:N-acetylglucosaminyl-phosphatidylinositol de-N-acetylase-like isoform X2 [Gordionus sp. m RMFG-2023]|uniref:N-acetylglucosaminyl-phosphatidylinositol de-N-acetylase-like isoform X2 n=1 Tax=Gordionus sp. m RMFG-2023 TaxID=3053472 RepID=UPI0031FC56BD
MIGKWAVCFYATTVVLIFYILITLHIYHQYHDNYLNTIFTPDLYQQINSRNHGYNLLIPHPSSSILFIIAHPDDEVLFFAPTLRYLKNTYEHLKKMPLFNQTFFQFQGYDNYNIYILCLTSGDYYGLGEIRKQELIASCQTLGIPSSRIVILNFADDPNVRYDSWHLYNTLQNYTDQFFTNNFHQRQINETYSQYIFTFDNYGVSGHLNHKSIFSGLRHFTEPHNFYNKSRMLFEIYTLQSINIIRKYLSIFDLPISYYSSRDSKNLIIISDLEQYTLSVRSFLNHVTQLRWFRYLYIVFSRYMCINIWSNYNTSINHRHKHKQFLFFNYTYESNVEL